jgi:NAD(P)-dependent dehydrogenase (short-subunit alcohol dehydrogenase family)
MNQIMLVTGASRGIGAAIARRAAQAGWDVAINYAGRADKAAEVAADVEAAGRRALCVQADVGNADQVAAMFAEVDTGLGPVTALINNAGIAEKMTMAKLDRERLARMLQINIAGCLYCVHEAVKRMGRSNGGSGGTIVNMSSRAAATGGMAGSIAYAATKGAVDSMTIGQAKELGPDGIRVAAIRPGLIHSDIHIPNGGRDGVEKMAAASVPLGRGGEPEEIAGLAVWLCGSEASYITGALFDVGGGR